MKVYQLGDEMTLLSHKGLAQEDVKVKIDGKLYNVSHVYEDDDELIIEASE